MQWSQKVPPHCGQQFSFSTFFITAEQRSQMLSMGESHRSQWHTLPLGRMCAIRNSSKHIPGHHILNTVPVFSFLRSRTIQDGHRKSHATDFDNHHFSLEVCTFWRSAIAWKHARTRRTGKENIPSDAYAWNQNPQISQYHFEPMSL